MSSNVHAAALTDVGRVRSNNEDAFGSDPALGVYLVSDGMGGRAAGEIASALTRDTVLRAFAAQTKNPDAPPTPAGLARAVQDANTAVWLAGDTPGQQGMGATLVAAALCDSHALIANVGDSRAYLLRGGRCTQITSDHSYIDELIRTGSVRPEDRHAPELRRFESVITRAIGAAPEVEPEFFPIDLCVGDAILLASDGLSRYLDADRIAALADPADLEGSCAKLIAAANACGGADNITCLMLRYDAPDEVAAPDEAAA